MLPTAKKDLAVETHIKTATKLLDFHYGVCEWPIGFLQQVVQWKMIVI